jgi:hypothetical protein
MKPAIKSISMKPFLINALNTDNNARVVYATLQTRNIPKNTSQPKLELSAVSSWWKEETLELVRC